MIWVQYKYLLTVKPNPDVSLPSFILTLIITGTLVIVSTGMNEMILGTAVGLFGTIAGYVLGRATHSDQKKEKESDADIKKPKTEVGKTNAAPSQCRTYNTCIWQYSQSVFPSLVIAPTGYASS